jgi:VWFA-related protein
MRSTLVTVLLLASLPLATTPLQDARFTARKRLVTVDVLVQKEGKSVSGLVKTDFELRDNGILQTPEVFSVGTDQINLILGLDASASVAGDTLRNLKQASRTVIQSLGPADRAALLTFGNTIDLRSDLTLDHNLVLDRLERVDARGETPLVDAAYSTMAVASNEPGRSLVILFTDGLDSMSWLTPAMALEAARRYSSVVYAVVPSGSADSDFVRQLTVATGGSVIVINSPAQLQQTFVHILDEFRSRYVLGFSPTNVPLRGWHTLRVTLKAGPGKGTVTARPGYQAGPDMPAPVPPRPR